MMSRRLGALALACLPVGHLPAQEAPVVIAPAAAPSAEPPRLTRERLSASIEAAVERLASEKGGRFFDQAQAAPTPKAPGKGVKIAYAVSQAVAWGALAYDIKTTRRGIERYGFREANPLMNRFGDRNIKGVVLSGLAWEAGRTALNHFGLFKHGHRKTAIALNSAAGGMHLGAGLWNRHLMREEDREAGRPGP